MRDCKLSACPEDFHNSVVNISRGQKFARNQFLRKLVDSLYSRNEADFKRGTFRVRGDTIDICLPYNDYAYRVTFLGNEIEEIESFNPVSGAHVDYLDTAPIYPANIFVTSQDKMKSALQQIHFDMTKQVEFFKSIGKIFEAKRIEERVIYDLEMINELGYCAGIENYSRYFDGRPSGSRPFCLLDYFPKDFIMIIDESHVTIPQIRAMYGGDHSRKQTLVEYGFRLPAAIDNRPLKFEEFEKLVGQTIFVSATPADYELEKAGGVIVEQVVRPTGLLDPAIEVRPSLNQIDHLIGEINRRAENHERVLVTTLTKRMAEELTAYLARMDIRCQYIHSDVDTLERVKIMDNLRNGSFDVLIGVNLLREGLDLPEVSLVAIIDADKEGFLRSERSLTQTAGRAARNINGKVIMYADKITESMQKTIDETNRRREKQLKYNEENEITPQQIIKALKPMIGSMYRSDQVKGYAEPETIDIAADPVIRYMDKKTLQKTIDKTRKAMEAASKKLDFIEAARYRDEMYALEKLLQEK